MPHPISREGTSKNLLSSAEPRNLFGKGGPGVSPGGGAGVSPEKVPLFPKEVLRESTRGGCMTRRRMCHFYSMNESSLMKGNEKE